MIYLRELRGKKSKKNWRLPFKTDEKNSLKMAFYRDGSGSTHCRACCGLVLTMDKSWGDMFSCGASR